MLKTYFSCLAASGGLMGVSGGVIKGSIGATKGISNSKSSFLKSFVIIGHLLSLD